MIDEGKEQESVGESLVLPANSSVFPVRWLLYPLAYPKAIVELHVV